MGPHSRLAKLSLCSLLLVCLPVDTWAQEAKTPSQLSWFNDVRPILLEHCAQCHGSKEQESGLRLDRGKRLLEGGDRGATIVPGKPEQSLLLQAIMHIGDVEAMPVDGEKLPAKKVAIIRDWIKQGAKVDRDLKDSDAATATHWAFQPLKRAEAPRVNQQDWIQNPIDAFVLAKLEALGIQPSPEADKRTLIRRVTFDLLGLPPTKSEVDRFLADNAPGAYERLVNRLLASPHYGERWGRHWLDLARYADSNGFTIDGERSIWLYRDWVIDAFNRDLPYNQFAIEQLAGDMLESPTVEQRIATGFHRNTLVNEEGGTNDEEFRVESVVDRVNTTSSIFLGLTIGCAQCHQHKYDPISQREFYQLYAVFNNTADSNDAGDSSGKLGPIVYKATDRQLHDQRELEAKIASAKQDLNALSKRLDKTLKSWEAQYNVESVVTWQPLTDIAVKSTEGATLKKLDDQSFLVTGNIPDHDVYEIRFRVPKASAPLTAIRLETLTHDSLPNRGPGLTKHGNFTLCEFEVFVGGQKRKITKASADYSQEKGNISQAIDGDKKSFWGIYGPSSVMNKDHEAIFILEKALAPEDEVRIAITQKYETPRYMIGRFRLNATEISGKAIDLPVEVRKILAKPADQRTAGETTKLLARMRSENAEFSKMKTQLDSLNAKLTRFKSQIPSTMVLRELDKVRKTQIHIRGDYLRKGAVVKANVPAVLPSISPYGDRVTRLDFAKWLMSPDHPLTTRVTVNRWWQRFFGLGIVETENDFGTQGSKPTHPELLDWLATELVRRKWGVKSFHRMIVTSSTYRQSSNVRKDLVDQDPRNRLLARQRRLRFEAEVIRDAALAASGLLTRTLKGPSVYPPQPKGIYVLTQNKKGWDAKEDKGSDRYRRGLYTFFWRSSPYPMLPTFDAPDANTTCTRRSRSNTPLQSLTLANDQAFFEIAVGLARRLATAEVSSDVDRLKLAYEWCLSRQPTQRELATLVPFLQRQRAYYNKEAAEAKQLAGNLGQWAPAEGASWIAVARVLLNLDEFITRE